MVRHGVALSPIQLPTVSSGAAGVYVRDSGLMHTRLGRQDRKAVYLVLKDRQGRKPLVLAV